MRVGWLASAARFAAHFRGVERFMSIFPSVIRDIINDVGRRRQLRPDDQVSSFHDWVMREEKIETHVHMEAAVDKSFYESLPPPSSWLESRPWERAPFNDLRAFIMAWVDLTRSIRKIADFEALAEEFVASRARSNIRYSEAYFSPADFSFMRKRFAIAPEVFDFADVMAAYVRGLRRGLKKNPGFEVRLIMDALWPSNAQERYEMKVALRATLAQPEFHDEEGIPYIVAVGLGGAENHGDIAGHISFINEVRGMGFKVDIHSGEGSDGTLHRRSVESLSPDRVSHGFAGVSQGYVFNHNVVMCPISNLLLKTFAGFPEEHPAFELLRKDIPVAIGSDDPLLLGHSLAQEFSFLFAVDDNFTRQTFLKIRQNTRARVLAPEVCSRVFTTQAGS